MHAIRLNPIILRINSHLWHRIIELHIFFSNFATVLDGLNAFLEVVGGDGAGSDGGLRDEEDRGLGHEGRKHGTGDDGLDGGDGGVRVSLFMG